MSEAHFYVGILHRRGADQRTIEFSAMVLDGDPMRLSEPAYQKLVRNHGFPWFKGDGSYQRARIFAHLLCDEARTNGHLGIEVEDLYNMVPDKLPEDAQVFGHPNPDSLEAAPDRIHHLRS